MCWNPVVLLIAAGLGSGFGNLTAHMSPLEEEEEEDNNTNKEEEEEVVSAILRRTCPPSHYQLFAYLKRLENIAAK